MEKGTPSARYGQMNLQEWVGLMQPQAFTPVSSHRHASTSAIVPQFNTRTAASNRGERLSCIHT